MYIQLSVCVNIRESQYYILSHDIPNIFLFFNIIYKIKNH